MPTIRSGDADIFYESSGEGDPLLLIMGLGTDSKAWVLQVPEFSKTHRVIVYDNRGVGRSSTPAGPYSTAQMAADALAVLDATSVERAHVLGVSLGGAIAQHLALKAPERVRSMVLASTWAGPSEWRSRLREMQLGIISGGGREALVRSRMLFVFAPPLFETATKFIRLVEQRMLEDSASLGGYLLHLDAAEGHDLRDRLGEIRTPTHVVTGRRDILVPFELSQEVASLIPGASFHLFDAGHALQAETAVEFNASVLEFINRH
jgi:pimeloyl-ACP methyl ester carboxylesterase